MLYIFASQKNILTHYILKTWIFIWFAKINKIELNSNLNNLLNLKNMII